MKKINVIVTGSKGYIGRNLYDRLKNNKKYNLTLQYRYEKDSKIIGDLRNISSFEDSFFNQDILVHLAFSKNYKENIEIMKNIITASKKYKIKKIILVSSMAAKRDYPDNYGKIKKVMENMIKQSGVSYTILRPSIIYGRGSTSFDFIINYMKRIPLFTPIIGDGKYNISPVYIEDVIYAIIKSIENRNTHNKEYDLSGGDKIHFKDLINKLKNEVKIKKINFYIPKWIAIIISMIIPRVISKENIRNLTQDSLADSSEAYKDFKYQPINFEEGVKNGLI